MKIKEKERERERREIFLEHLSTEFLLKNV